MLGISARPTPARTPLAVRAAPVVAFVLVALNALDLLTTHAILALSNGREAIPWYGYPSMPVYVILKLATPLALLVVVSVAVQRQESTQWRATAFTVASMLLFIAVGMALVVANNAFWLTLTYMAR